MIINSNSVFSRQLYQWNGCPQTCPILSETPIFENFQLQQQLLQAPQKTAISYQANITKHMPGNMDDSTGDVNVLMMNGAELHMSMAQSGLYGRASCQEFLIPGMRLFPGHYVSNTEMIPGGNKPTQKSMDWENPSMHTKNLWHIALLWWHGRH